MKFSTVFVASVVLLAGILCGVSGDLRYRGNALHPDQLNYPNECYYEELNQAIKRNQSYKPINRDDRCESIYCRPDYVLEILSCSRHNLQPNATCRIEADMRRAYPDCCPKLSCQTEDNFV